MPHLKDTPTASASTPIPGKTPCVIYAAKSTQDKHKSIPTQVDDGRDMAAEEDWVILTHVERGKVVDHWKDEGFSAYSGNRGPGLVGARQQAEEAAEAWGVPCVLVGQHTDRFARGAGDRPGAAQSLTEVWYGLRRSNVTLRTKQNDYACHDEVAIASASKQAYEESKRKSESVTDGKRRRAERGQQNGAMNFGYVFDNPESIHKRRVPEPREAKAFIEIKDSLRNGASLAELTRWLNANGYTSKQGNPFVSSRVSAILANPYYAGKVKLPDGELVDGDHDPLITWDEHLQILADLKAIEGAPRGKGGRHAAVPTLLNGGVLSCAKCGKGVYQRILKSGKRTLMCGNVRLSTGLCDACGFDAEPVELAVLDHLGRLFVDLDGLIQTEATRRERERDVFRKELSGLMAEREDLDKTVTALEADYVAKVSAGDETAAGIASRQIERLSPERDRIGQRVADAEARLSEWDGEADADAVLDWWSELTRAVQGEIVNAPSVADANAALRHHFAAIYVDAPEGGSIRLDFILRDKPPGSDRLVDSQLFVHSDEDVERATADGLTLLTFVGDDHAPTAGDAGVKPVGSPS